MEYIEWDKLEQIPFCLCRIAEDEENQEIDVYYLDKRVCHDYKPSAYPLHGGFEREGYAA